MAFTARTETYVDVASLTTPFDITVTKPTGTIDGDILFCRIGWTDYAIDSVPSGWTELGSYTASSDKHALYYKIAASEPSDWIWSLSASCRVRAVCSCYTGGDFDPADPIDVVSNTAYRTSDANCIAASMAVSAVNSPLVFWAGAYSGSSKTFTKPSVPTTDWVEDDDAGSTTSMFYTEVCSMIWSGSGATGNMIAIISAATTGKHAFAVALNPSGAGAFELSRTDGVKLGDTRLLEPVVVPTAIPQAATNIGGATARINGKISNDGGASCEARFRWREKLALYEYYITGHDAASLIRGSEWRAQTFTPSVAHTITSVKLLIYRNGNPGSLTVSIRATDVDGKPTGGDLCSGTTDGDTLPVSPPYEWREITLGSGYSLSADTTYAIVLKALSGSIGNDVRWRIDSTSPTYDGGYYAYSNDSGVSWTMVTGAEHEDQMFEERGVQAWATTEWQNTLVTNSTYYKDLTDLDPGTEYEFQTQPRNSAGEGAWSASAYFTTIFVLSIVDSILVGESSSQSMVAGLSIIDGLKSGDTTGLPGLLNMLDGLKLGDSPSLLASLLASDGVKIRDATKAKYEYYNTGDVVGSCIHDTDWRGQTFTPSIAHKITSVKLKLARVGLPGTLTVSIRATDGEDKPTGGDLCSGTTDADTLTTAGAGEWREISLGSGYNLSASTRYAIVLRALSGDASNYVSWRADNTSPTYTDGCNVASVNSGSSWILFPTADMMFEEWDALGTSISLTMNPSVADGLKLGDSNILNFLISLLVTDGTKLGDSLSILARLIISDGLELGDSPSREMLATLLRSDGVELGDAATLGEAILYLAIVEGLRAGDTSLIGMLADILASDGTKLGDATIQSLLASLGIEDGLKLGDTELAELVIGGILLSIIEGIKIGDSTSLENLIALAILEAIKVGDTGGLGGVLGRILKLVIVTTQYRKVDVITCQKRKLRTLTSQKRKVRVLTGE